MKKFLIGILTSFMLVFGGCQNSLDYPNPNPTDTVQLVQEPEVYAYSGGQMLGTRGVNVNVNQWAENYQCQNATKDLTDQDIENIKTLLSKGSETYNEVALPWPSYFVQQVYKGESTYYATDKNGTETFTQVNGSNQMDKLVAWNGSEYEHINNFNNGDNTNNASCSLHNHLGTTLMYNMPTENIDPNKQFGYYETWGTLNKDRNENHYIIVEYNGDWYVGFDYHSETDRQNPGEASKVDRDWNFTDWIVRISPAYPINYDGDLWEGDLNNDDTKLPDTPSTVLPTETPDHVEINLSIEERDGVEWLASHLSIHVRAVTDVEVFIPLPAKFYCALDDMAIVQKHEDGLMIHGGPQTSTFTINGDVVSMTVAFDADGIRVTTSGINENVIGYLNETYGDGLTFEVWNYMNLKVKDWSNPDLAHGEDVLGYGQENAITVDELRGYLNGSTVEFTHTPNLYVNAFNNTEDGSKFIDDCTVNIVSEQELEYLPSQTDYWFNGSPYNELYFKY